MPKKNKVNKLAKMSDEERARYLQHRADLEEEARRRKRELIARFIKNKLDKEEAYNRMNRAKINQEWRYILRRIKCKQMASDIQGIMASFNFLIERKDRLIQTLMKSIDDSDDQHRRAFQAHTDTLSYFLSIGSQRLDKLQAEYDSQKILLLEMWDKEEFDITNKQDQAEFKLRIITYKQSSDFKAYKNETHLRRATAKNNAKLEHEEDLRILSRPKRLEIETYWSKLREVYNAYLEQHNPIMAHYQALKEKDDFYTKDIAKNDQRVQRASRLEDSKEKLDKILQLYKICCKYEHFTNETFETANESVVNVEHFENLDNAMINECKEYTKMDNFMLKLNRVKVQTLCLKKEKTKLAEENIQLKLYIKRYLTDLALRGGKDRPQSMNIQSTSRPLEASRKAMNRPVTCIEGALSNAVLHEKRMKIFEKKHKESGIIRAYPRVQMLDGLMIF
ncbi:hypothetical protein ACJJTC_004793 [Scirpophaga incertulas]